MAECIEREKLLLSLKVWQNTLIETYGENDAYVRCIESVLIGIESAPAADVRPKWISVKEKLPELRQNVLVSDGKGSGEGWLDRYDWHDPNREDVVYISPWPMDFWCIPGCKVDEDHVTHWMPLPEPPNCGARMEES